MKIASIFAAMPGNHSGLLEVKKIVSDTLTELGVVPEDINLGYRSLPYYDGIKSDYMSSISECLAASAGVIIYAGASFGLPGALLQTLAEHFNFSAYQGIMHNKNCFIIMNCEDGSGAYAMSALELSLENMGAFCQTKLLIDRHFAQNLNEGDKRYIMVERLCEDYYRALRQQRTVYRPQAPSAASPPKEPDRQLKALESIIENASPIQTIMPGQQNLQQYVESLNLGAFGENQQQDIEEISNFFSNKFKNYEIQQFPQQSQQSPVQSLFVEKPIIEAQVPRTPLLAQRTSSLTHYFKPGQAEGLKAGIALNIGGADGFEGYISINTPDCDFRMGELKTPDVTIITDGDKWADIIQGKISAQKAFMIGQIKVRGNFVLLSKFDQLFDFNKNVF